MGNVIAAVKDIEEFELALKSGVEKIFYLYPNIGELEYIVDVSHKQGKKLYIHIDLTAGLGKDKSGILYAKDCGIDGIISTRTNLIKAANECDIETVQRFFIVDSHSIGTTIDALKSSKPDFLEAMPGIAPKIIEKLKSQIDIPIIAGGLIDTETEVKTAVRSGAYAVSTGANELWNI